MFVVDILVSSETEEDEEDDFPVQIKGLSGSPLQVVMEGVGWWFGPSIEGAGFPGGVQIVIGDAFRIIIEELSIATRENGGHYLVISGGLGVERGEFRFRGLRFKLGGSPDAPKFGIDGFFGTIEAETFYLEVGGYFEDRREGGLRIKEFGFTGTFEVYLDSMDIIAAIDLIIGHISGAQDFKYFMVQAYVGFVIPVGSFELLSIRALFADDMQPKLSPADEDSRDLRYYQWYRRTDPTVVSGDRRLNVWEAMKDAWGIGVGVGASVAGMGDIVNLSIFVLGIDRPEGGGFLFTGEAFLLEGAAPIAYLVLEWDGEEDQFSFLLVGHRRRCLGVARGRAPLRDLR